MSGREALYSQEVMNAGICLDDRIILHRHRAESISHAEGDEECSFRKGSNAALNIYDEFKLLTH